MRYIVLALFAAGCSNWTNYDVRVGAETAPICTGLMQLTENTGTWSCFPYGGSAHVLINTEAPTFLDLETRPGFLNRVRITSNTDTSMSGTIAWPGDNGDVTDEPFVAIGQ